jgi:AcrR family transcriptional regulator
MELTQPEPKWQRRADARPDELLDAALELFMQHGFAATRVEQIADKAGLSKGAVYRYFASKEEILESIVRRGISPLTQRATALATAGEQPAPVILRAVLSTIVTGLMDKRTMAIPRIVLSEAGNFPALAKMYRREVIDVGIAAMSKIIQQGIDEGSFRPVEPSATIKNILGPLMAHLLLSQVFGDGQKQTVEQTNSFLDSHLDVLLNGLVAKGEVG